MGIYIVGWRHALPKKMRATSKKQRTFVKSLDFSYRRLAPQSAAKADNLEVQPCLYSQSHQNGRGWRKIGSFRRSFLFLRLVKAI